MIQICDLVNKFEIITNSPCDFSANDPSTILWETLSKGEIEFKSCNSF